MNYHQNLIKVPIGVFLGVLNLIGHIVFGILIAIEERRHKIVEVQIANNQTPITTFGDSKSMWIRSTCGFVVIALWTAAET